MQKKDALFLGLAFLLSNLRATIFVYLYPDTTVLMGPAWIEIGLWLLITGIVIYRLIHDRELNTYLHAWRGSWLLGLFLLLALGSLFWSIEPIATLFRALELFLAAFAASYFGMRLGPGRLMTALFWFGAVLFILSIALALGAPPTGTMYWAPFHGAWRGVYWHRNHLASMAAFLSIIYLCRMVLAFRNRHASGILDVVLYLLALVILYFARSATGYIVFIVLHMAGILVWAWLRVEHRLHRRHYLGILGAGILSVLLTLSNLDLVFGLFGRDSTMTGRVGLWSELMEMGLGRPWLGHGFGAVWTLDSFRNEVQRLAGWTSQPLIGDNGWLDIFLHLGFVGLLVFSGILVVTTVRAFRYGVRQKTLTGFFPLIVMLYALFANITFSLFAETEVFVWFLIVAALFMTSSSGEGITS